MSDTLGKVIAVQKIHELTAKGEYQGEEPYITSLLKRIAIEVKEALAVEDTPPSPDYAERLAAKRELYGRLHQVIELFQSGQLSAEAYSKLHSDITDRITTLTKEKQ